MKQETQDFSKEQEQKKECTDPNHPKNVSPQNHEQPFLIMLIFHIENTLKSIYLPAAISFQTLAYWLAPIICILAILRQYKFPYIFRRQYWIKVIPSEYFHNLWYCLPFWLYPSYTNSFFYVPLMIHFWIGICEWINIQQGFLYEKMKKRVDITRQNKEEIIQRKHQFEIYYIFILFVYAFIYSHAFIFIFIYFNFLRIKHVISPKFRLQIVIFDKLFLDQTQKLPFFLKYLPLKLRSALQWFCEIKIKTDEKQK